MIAREARYLGGIALLAREGHIELVTSAELYAEFIRQPSGRFKGYGYHDLNVFDGLHMPSVDGYVAFTKNPRDDQYARVANSTDKEFVRIRSVFPRKSNLDAWHLYTVKKYGLYCFLAIDEPLISTASALTRDGRLPPEARAMLPSQLGAELGIRPLPTNIFQAIDGNIPPHVGLVFETNHRFRPPAESGRMSIYGTAVAGAGPVSVISYDDPKEAIVKKLPAVADMKGLKFDHATSTAILTYHDKNGQWLELDLPLPQAMFLLSLVKGLQLNLDIPFPDDPRSPDASPVRPSEKK